MHLFAIFALQVASLSQVTAKAPQHAKKRFDLPLSQNQQHSEHPLAHVPRALQRYASRATGAKPTTAVLTETLEAGAWYSIFDVGLSRNLSLQLDTGSYDILTNPQIYKPSHRSQNLNVTGNVAYETWLENGCGNAKLEYNKYKDTVSIAGLTLQEQVFGSVTHLPAGDNESYWKTGFPHDGIAGLDAGDSGILGTSWFQQLCNNDQLQECRFGLVLETNGTGRTILGTLDQSLFDGNLVVSHGNPLNGWNANVLVDNSTVLIPNISISLFDSGTVNILAPIEDARKVFEHFGIQAVETTQAGCSSRVLLGYYPCENPPTTFGLQFPSVSGAPFNVSAPVFNVEPEAFLQPGGVDRDNNCTAVILGVEGSTWLMGQAFLQGKYVDQQYHGMGLYSKIVSFATLKNSTEATTSSSTSGAAGGRFKGSIGVWVIALLLVIIVMLR